MNEKTLAIGRIVFACILAEIVNFAFVICFSDALQVPLFLDTVGTVAITFYAGLVPGLAVAFAFNVIRTVSFAIAHENAVYPWEMLYFLCGIAIVFCTWIFSRKKDEFRMSIKVTVLYLILISLVSTFASSFVGGAVESLDLIVFEGMAYKSPVESYVKAFLGENISTFISCFIARMPVTMLDRLVCTFAGFLVYVLVTYIERKEEKPA
ncbi:MAG: hypothetical protein K6G00_11870 [Treponema sp.]|nr:hypothetical protein [Treponema sp.]